MIALIPLLTIAQTPTPVTVDLEVVATGYSSPNGIYNAGDNRLFILEKDLARIRIIDLSGTNLGTFLDINPIAGSGGERGLLGMAFHPDYDQNGFFYVNYTNNSGNTVIERYSVSADPNVADAGSALEIMTINQPFGNHNGGHIAFGPDGYLYIGMGDGGSANDPIDAGQTGTTLLGKMLRIDVDNPEGGNNYAIPADNPFLGDGSVLDEVWSLGMRNPWKFSFDRIGGDLWIADVGQNDWEEVNRESSSSSGGLNYGWVCYEGFHPNPNISPCGDLPEEDVFFPVAEYSHGGDGFCSITGGFVYRGGEFPGMTGHYIFTDYCNGRLYSLSPSGGGSYDSQIVRNVSGFGFVAFGEGPTGELYLANISSGTIYKLTEECGSFDPELSVVGQSLDAGSGVDFYWYQDGNLIPGENSSTYSPDAPGSYYALVDNGTCSRYTNSIDWEIVGGVLGCTYDLATNYDPNATLDDGQCIFPGPVCPNDVNGDGVVNTADLTSLLSAFGSNCL